MIIGTMIMMMLLILMMAVTPMTVMERDLTVEITDDIPDRMLLAVVLGMMLDVSFSFLRRR